MDYGFFIASSLSSRCASRGKSRNKTKSNRYAVHIHRKAFTLKPAFLEVLLQSKMYTVQIVFVRKLPRGSTV
jgi:hypothetical protein